MKIWTYQEAFNKIIADLDLQDETFITTNEMIGYFNDALTEAESEIQALNQDYFLTKYYVPLDEGTKLYDLPENIFANKIRGIFFQNGSINYPVKQIRRKNKFANIMMTDQYAPNADYEYLLTNSVAGQSKFEIHPAARESAIYPPQDGSFTPMTMWYIRNCARVPLVGEFCNPEVIDVSLVDTTANTIAVNSGSSNIGIVAEGVVGCYPGSKVYITGDAVRLYAGPGGSIPSPLVEGTTYYVIKVSDTSIKLATTKALAVAGTAIDLTTAGTVFFTIEVMATSSIVNGTILDIPEFTSFVLQYVKCKCMAKEGDPRFASENEILVAQKKQMVDTLSEGIQDDDNEIQPDFSFYDEMS